MKKNLECILIILLLLTYFAYCLGYLEYISKYLVASLLMTTFVKGQLVIDNFMGLKDVRLKYRMIPVVWLGITIVLITLAYYLPIS
jgi:cytochrome c oxidase subunit 4